jgi:hypothetical protein
MRAREFITENERSIQHSVERALPATYIIPSLSGNDPYRQYRFGVAMAGAKGRAGDKADKHKPDTAHPYKQESDWGQEEIIVGFEPGIDKWIDEALGLMGLPPSGKQRVNSIKSEETTDVQAVSPIKPFAGYKK